VQNFAIRVLIGLLTGFTLVYGCDSMFAATVEGRNGIRRPWDRPVARYDLVLGLRLDRNLQFKLQYSISDQDGDFEQGQHFAATRLMIKF
jgi:hypothetical protein